MHILSPTFLLPLSLSLSLFHPLIYARPSPTSECPSHVGRQALTNRFFESVFEQPDRNHTSDALSFYSPSIHIIDNTTDYPSPNRGIPYPTRNLYAWNRDMFLAEVAAHIPFPYYGVISSPVEMSLTNAVGNVKKPCYIVGGLDVSGVLVRDYGGHKQNDPVELKVTALLDLMDDDTDHIAKVTYHVDWSQWYATLPS